MVAAIGAGSMMAEIVVMVVVAMAATAIVMTVAVAAKKNTKTLISKSVSEMVWRSFWLIVGTFNYNLKCRGTL